MKAILRYKSISSKKANLVAALIRGKKAEEALNILKFTPKKGAGILYRVVKSAVSNAENNFKQKKEDLYIKEILVSEGPTQKRHIPVSKGRAHPILKRSSHISVEMGVTAGKEAKEPEKAETPKKKTPKPKKAEKVTKA